MFADNTPEAETYFDEWLDAAYEDVWTETEDDDFDPDYGWLDEYDDDHEWEQDNGLAYEG